MTSSEPSTDSDAAALTSAVTMLGPRYSRRGGIGLELGDAGLQFRLLEAVETGGTDYRSLSVGDRIYISDQPERRLQSGPAFSSAPALLRHLGPALCRSDR